MGVSWWSLDHHLGIRHSQIDASLVNYADLRRYNTIILPSGYRDMGEYEKKVLSDWMEQGGTLIAHAASSYALASEQGIGSVKLLQNTFEESEKYNISLQRELSALYEELDIESVNSNKVDLDTAYPWEQSEGKYPPSQLEYRDNWQSIFMPSGAFVSGRTDQEHWLTFGTNSTLPLLYGSNPVLMSDDSSEAPIRVGVFSDSAKANTYSTINWSDIPPGKEINVRMSGLLWPEAAQRIANSAYLTRDRIGKGQLILFSGEPNFRGATLGTNRVWLNAVVYGAGLGTEPRINP